MHTTKLKTKSIDVGVLSVGKEKVDPAEAAAGRINCIATMAYYKAEARGFAPGKEVEDWLEAEAEFDGNETLH